jgi:hypothetical protein
MKPSDEDKWYICLSVNEERIPEYDYASPP